MQKKLDVVFTINENYIQHFCVACTSLFENNKNIGRIFLVQDINQGNKKLEKTIDYLEQKYNIKIEKLSLDSKILESFKITHHISKATYFRLLLSEILPKDVDSVMFLDSDIVINGSLDDILELDFLREDNIHISYQDGINDKTYSSNYEYYIFAVNYKFDEDELSRLRRIGFEGNKYFNAGIMYINLKKWRNENISKTLIDNATKYNEHLVWWDQDVLNITFDKEWGELDFKFNAFGLNEKDDSKNYKIIHYIGSSKPWHFRNKHPYKHLYWKYLRMTPFKRYSPEDLTVINVIKWMIPRSIKEFIKGIK
ncbi:MAG: glycosyltransferase family 8 protein [Aliarcobacter butzleri]|nr:glycosyltransferase family 8 protein [Aliarcobacter butzleri]